MEIQKSLSATLERLRADSLPEYALHYYDALKAQFEMLRAPVTQSDETKSSFAHAYEDAKRVAEIPRDKLTWANLMQFDLAIVRTLPFDCLRLKVAELRNRLGSNAIPLPHELSPRLESIQPNQIATLTCEAESLVTQLWQCRIARNSRDRYVGELRRMVSLTMMFIVIVASAAPYVLTRPTPIHVVIFVAGMVGALISILRRLQSVATAAAISLDQGNDLSALAYEKRAILISLVSGGVFATVLYVAFVAGLADLSGKLAPEFSGVVDKPEGGVNFYLFANNVAAKTAADYAKVVVWSFAAGFFEQLVPDVLDRMMKREEKKKA